MGNICGKSEAEPFDSPGRVLGSAPPPGPRTAPVPNKVGGPPRTLGGSSSPEASSRDQSDARAKAAEAAEARAKASVKSGGKLQTQLTERQKADLRTTVARDAKMTAEQRAADNAKQNLDYN
ncbi:hypothetical protein B0T10DRAFT_473583 [Thelonectria olida]|uniref:Uncharacterized protein n=1 Tax=Thelonectria olida TaxID=1576542 RepID=A0A9P8WGU7_9HYPO|nr:hypothetical protein B0T10DRAFT_473583 [Thelonectria olida]